MTSKLDLVEKKLKYIPIQLSIKEDLIEMIYAFCFSCKDFPKK